MDLFEYQGKQFFAQYGMPISAGEVVFTVDEALAAAERLGTPVMVKSQVLAGGRGKLGGIKFAPDMDAVREHPAMAQWIAEATAEDWILPSAEIEVTTAS